MAARSRAACRRARQERDAAAAAAVRPVSRSYSDPAADGIRAAKTDAAVFAARERGDLDELANIAAVMGFEEFGARYEADASIVALLKRRSDAVGVLQIMSVDVLVAVRRGELDLNALASKQLADRGLDSDGKWVGFERAAALAKEVR